MFMFTDDEIDRPVLRQLTTCSGLAVASVVSGLTVSKELDLGVLQHKIYKQHEVEALKISANFFGAISAGLSLYFIGRRWTAILVCAMFILPLVAIAIDYGPRTELAGVVALNVARTQLYATFSVYAAEVTAPNLRASVISVYFVSYNMGEFVGTLFPRGSRTLTMVSLLVTLGSTALAFKATNTPHWLSLKGRRPEAAQLFKWLRGDADVEELEAMQNKLKAPAVGGRAAFVFKFYTPLALFVGLRLAYADSCELVRPTFDDAVRLYEFTLHDSLSDPVFMGLTTVSLFHYGGALLGSVIAVGLCLVAGRRLLFLASSLLGISIFYVHLFAFVSVKTAFYATLFCDFFNFLGAEQIIIIMPTEIFPATLRELAVVTCECITLVIQFVLSWATRKGLESLEYRMYYYTRWTLVPLGVFLCFYFLPETKNLPLAQAEELGAELKVQFVDDKDEEPE